MCIGVLTQRRAGLGVRLFAGTPCCAAPRPPACQAPRGAGPGRGVPSEASVAGCVGVLELENWL